LKIALTGHTWGFGKHIIKQYKNYIGFSKSNGYNIDKLSDRDRIIEESSSADIFINNTHSKKTFAQTELLIEFFRAYRDTNKTIINVGSDITKIDILKYPEFIKEYSGKKYLKDMVYALQSCKGFNLKIIYKSFGFWEKSDLAKFFPELIVDTTIEEAIKELFKDLNTYYNNNGEFFHE